MKKAATPKLRMPALHWVFRASARIAKNETVVRKPTVQLTAPLKVTSVGKSSSNSIRRPVRTARAGGAAAQR